VHSETSSLGNLRGPELAHRTNIKSERKTVLLVDDYRSLREGIRVLLSDEYEVIAVENGEEAVQVGRSLEPDLILLDLKLPGISGEEVLFQMRLSHVRSPVLIISAIHDPTVAANLFRMGACDYLTKPFGIRELKRKIREILEADSIASVG
jgi:DNA-binding response OmpR family regulator